MTGKLRLPPLNALRVFHAVVRHASLKQAADELLVTPQAVGQQIKLLEDTLQVTLFERKGRNIEPTEYAVLLSHYVNAGFAEFAEGVKRITKSNYRNRLNLNASPYFATRYLMYLLASFREIIPGVDLRLTTIVDTPDFARDDIDLSVQWGYGEWADLDVTLLVRDPKMICCSPEIGREIKAAKDIHKFNLLHAMRSKRLWPDILHHLNIEQSNQDSDIGFDDAQTMRRATIQGMGIGLVSVIDAREDLKAGILVAPLGEDALKDMPEKEIPGFYLLTPRAHLRVKVVEKLHRWLVQQDWDKVNDKKGAVTATLQTFGNELPNGF